MCRFGPFRTGRVYAGHMLVAEPRGWPPRRRRVRARRPGGSMKASLGKVGSLKLRTADPGDKEFAYQVKKAAFREYVEQVWGWDEDEQRGLHDRRFRAEEFHIFALTGDTDTHVLMERPPDPVPPTTPR